MRDERDSDTAKLDADRRRIWGSDLDAILGSQRVNPRVPSSISGDRAGSPALPRMAVNPAPRVHQADQKPERPLGTVYGRPKTIRRAAKVAILGGLALAAILTLLCGFLASTLAVPQ